MPNYRLVAPYIRWGTNLANAIYFPFPADRVFSGSEPRPGSQFVQAPSGVEAASRVGTDYVWAGTQRWIAQSDTLFYPRCTGWDGTLGARVAIEQLQNKNTFSWHPDGRNLLRRPLLNNAGDATLGGFGGWSSASDAGLTGVTIAFDAGNAAWKIVATNPTGGLLTARLFQYVPSIPGEATAPSVDYKVSGLAGGATGRVQVFAYDATPNVLSLLSDLTGLTSTVFVRASAGFGTAAPASTAYMLTLLELNLPGGAGATGTVWFKNAMLRRDAIDPTFIDNPSVDGCYLVDPTQFSPANETDGSRQLVMRIRNPTTPFDGY